MINYVGEAITGRKNPLVVRLSKLSDKKYRDAERLFRIDGIKLFSEAVKSGIKIKYAFVSMSRREKIEAEVYHELEAVNCGCYLVSDEVLAKLTDETAPQGIVGIAEKIPMCEDKIPQGDFRGVYLSQIRDPGNLGTMIRTAYAFGLDRVYISSDCADIYSPKAIRAAMGTSFRQKISMVSDEITFAREMREAEVTLFAAALRRNSTKLGAEKPLNRVCAAIGNEGHGLSDEFIEACEDTIFIPMNDGCESLNAAAAAAVLMWELSRDKLI